MFSFSPYSLYLSICLPLVDAAALYLMQSVSINRTPVLFTVSLYCLLFPIHSRMFSPEASIQYTVQTEGVEMVCCVPVLVGGLSLYLHSSCL